MSDTVQNNSGGIGVAGALGIAFIVLKLTDVIGWSWWWVLAPFWIPWAFLGVILLVWGFILLVAALVDH